MSTFDQRGQRVNYQYNAAGNINFGAVQNRLELVTELEKLQGEMTKAIEASVFDESLATDVDYRIKKAVQEAKKDEPNKKTILEHLEEAKNLIKEVAAAGGLVMALVKAVELVRQFF